MPLSTDDAAARCRSSDRAASSSCSATGNKAAPASLSRSPSGNRSNRVGPPKTASKAATRRPTVGWLMPRARLAARKDPCRATARKMRASFQSSRPEPLLPFTIHPRIGPSQKCGIPDLQVYHYVGSIATCLLEAAMRTATIRSPESFRIFNGRTPWRPRLRSILSSRWQRKNEESKHDSLYRLDDRLLADLGLYREHRIHNPRYRTDQERGSPVPAVVLAMWMPRI